MISTYNSETFNLAQYTAANNTLCLIETCDSLGNVSFEIHFEDIVYTFNTINSLSNYLLRLSLQQADPDKKLSLLGDIDEVLSFLEGRHWTTDNIAACYN